MGDFIFVSRDLLFNISHKHFTLILGFTNFIISCIGNLVFNLCEFS